MASSRKIKRDIKAKTPELLELEMTRVLVQFGMEYVDFQHIQFAKGFWYAWYLAEAKILEGLTNGPS